MSYRKQKKLSLLPTRSDGLASFLLISFHRCCPLSFGETHFCQRKTPKKIITSDHRGFAGVRPTATHAPPANVCWSEVIFLCVCLAPGGVGLVGGGKPLAMFGCHRLSSYVFCCRLYNQKHSSTNFNMHIFPQALSDFDEEI